MRIHTSKINDQWVFRDAANRAGVQIERITVHGSQSRTRAFDVLLSGRGVTGGQWGNSGKHGAGPYKAATWDEWGIFLNHLFAVDPAARIPRVYESADHFHWATGDRFWTLTPERQHLRHNWLSGGGGRSAMGSYYAQSCKCGAVHRWLAPGHTFDMSIRQEFDGVI